MEIFSIEAYFFTFYSTLQYITLILITISVETNTSQLRTRLYITIREMFPASREARKKISSSGTRSHCSPKIPWN